MTVWRIACQTTHTNASKTALLATQTAQVITVTSFLKRRKKKPGPGDDNTDSTTKTGNSNDGGLRTNYLDLVRKHPQNLNPKEAETILKTQALLTKDWADKSGTVSKVISMDKGKNFLKGHNDNGDPVNEVGGFMGESRYLDTLSAGEIIKALGLDYKDSAFIIWPTETDPPDTKIKLVPEFTSLKIPKIDEQGLETDVMAARVPMDSHLHAHLETLLANLPPDDKKDLEALKAAVMLRDTSNIGLQNGGLLKRDPNDPYTGNCQGAASLKHHPNYRPTMKAQERKSARFVIPDGTEMLYHAEGADTIPFAIYEDGAWNALEGWDALTDEAQEKLGSHFNDDDDPMDDMDDMDDM